MKMGKVLVNVASTVCVCVYIYICIYICIYIYILCMGRDSSVGIATRYGPGGPGIESRWSGAFSHLSRPVLGPTQPPIQWVPGLSRGKAAGACRWPSTPIHRSPIRVTIHHILTLCTSFHITKFQTTIFNFWYFILIAVLPSNHNFNQNHIILTVEWSSHAINISIFLHLPPWRRPHQ